MVATVQTGISSQEQRGRIWMRNITYFEASYLHESLLRTLLASVSKCARHLVDSIFVMVFWTHYKALLYKNWVLWRRKLFISLCEVLSPIALMAIIVIIRESISASSHDGGSYLDDAQYVYTRAGNTTFPSVAAAHFSAASNFQICSDYREENPAFAAAVVPDSGQFVEDFVAMLKQQPLLQGATVMRFPTEDDLEDYVTSSDYGDLNKDEHNPPLCFAVVFDTPIGPNYSYSIRYNNTESVYSGVRRVGDFIDIFSMDLYDSVDEYTRTPTRHQQNFAKYGFLAIQNIVDNLILKKVSNKPDAYITPGFVPMYFDKYIDDPFMEVIISALPLFIIITYVIPVGRMIANTVSEKESRIKEVMMMMGMTNSAYWASWVTYYFCLYTVLAGVITIITQVHVFEYSSGGFIFLFFWLFGISCIAYCFFLQTFFSRSKTAFIIGVMLFLIEYFISFAVSDRNTSESSKNSASLLPPAAFVLGCNNLGNFEKGRIGITSDTVSDVFEHYKFSTCLIMFAIDTVIFTVLGLYLEQVFPNEIGIKQPWHFPFTWCCRSSKSSVENIEKKVKWGEDVEDVDLALEQQKDHNKAMLVRGLTKHFNHKVAVDDLNLDIYEGQIFALLGHNGAGKTTTISMLTGMLPATRGEMTVHGRLLSKDIQSIRKNLGVCPQHNVLFAELTVLEHLYVFSVFKGVTDKKIMKAKIDEIIEAVNLEHQVNVRADRLSGGQKRKLSLAIALIGDSPIVFLDEPTAGMDITARRQMWDMLKNNKSGRIILLTTHYMEEADILADRIAIISDGQLRCCGSPLYLKNRFGVGYYLNLVKEAGLMSQEHSTRVKEFIKTHVQSAMLMHDIPGEIAFQIPLQESSHFRDMFMELDRRLKELGLHSYGISVTTLEEVFLKVAQGSRATRVPPSSSNEPLKEVQPEVSESQPVLETNGVDFFLAKDRVEGSLFLRHAQALLRKRLLSNLRDFKSLACEIIVPIALVLLGLGLMLISMTFKNVDSYDLAIDQFPTPQSVFLSQYSTFDRKIMDKMKLNTDVKVETQGAMSLEAFDRLLFDERVTDPYRMGSVYFFKTNTTTHQYEPVIFHNQTALEAVPIYYQFVSLAILQTINSSVSISVANHPFPITHGIKSINGGRAGFTSSVIFSLGFAFIPVGIIAFIVREKEMAIKHQHLVSGVSLPAYWITNYVWDFTKHFFPAVICALFVLAFRIDALTYPSDSYGALWLLMVLYGFSVSTFTYFTSFFFKTSGSSQNITLLLHFISGSILPSVIFVLYMFDQSRNAAHALVWIFRFFPNFCFGMGLMNLGNRESFAFRDGHKDAYKAFDVKNAGGDIMMLVITSVLYLVLLFVMEWLELSPSVRRCLKGSIPSDLANDFVPDDDVEAEKVKAHSITPADAQVVVRGLRQVYRNLFSSPILGVDEVSMTVDYKECFALLGVNGAGKTSTFRMLTGEYAPTAGEAYVGGRSVVSEMSRVRKVVGYCPQFDALNELLTGKELLEMYADLKGIPRTRRAELVEEILQEMDLKRYENIKCGTYSGGNKRKLSVAIALLGNPSVVFLDEPSAGMDPEARKKMWRVIGNIKKRNSAVVLTTHSMEEAETLCDRIAIMVAGRLRCLGTATRIKNKFGSGYELEIKVTIPTEDQVVGRMQTLHTQGNLTEAQVNTALVELGHADYEAELNLKGRGASIFTQLRADKFVPATTLIAWVLTEEIGDRIYQFLCQQFATVKVIEHYLSFFKYKVERQEDRTLGFLFSCVETNKEQLHISEYSVTQTSLEQIFNQFARMGGPQLD